MVYLYAFTAALSAALLFSLEPLFGRFILPLFGGSAAVWTTLMLFFQVALLMAYGYSHLSISKLGVFRQRSIHLALLLLGLLFLPVAIPQDNWVRATSSPIFSVLLISTALVGLPFIAVATTSSIIQSWFTATGLKRSADPYFLYAASNTGSLIGLLGYPLFAEPMLTLHQQALWWARGYVALGLLIATCAFWKRPARVAASGDSTSVPRPAGRARVLWVLLGFVPSSLLLGVTTYLTSEVAVLPLLWVVPLALYLLSFTIAFATDKIPVAVLERVFRVLVLIWVLTYDMLLTRPVSYLIALHLLVFLVSSLLCNVRLAASRPPAKHLPEFYLWVAVGGALGGVFNGIVAPLLFTTVAEYPMAFVGACWAAQSVTVFGHRSGFRSLLGDLLWAALPAAMVFGVVYFLKGSRIANDTQTMALFYGAGAIACYFFSNHSRRFAVSIAALILAGALHSGGDGRTLFAARSFYGIHRVILDSTGEYHVLLNGITVHGRQAVDPSRASEPLSYYSRSGPAGDVIPRFADHASRIGVVGLGAGSLAAYGTRGQDWSFFEIDPAVARIARDPRYFTYLQNAKAHVSVVLGDARQSLAAESDASYDLIVLDAYSSDYIPVHLMTREALAMYRKKLKPHGILLFHISNIHLDLEPVFGDLARDAGLVAFTCDHTQLTDREIAAGDSPTTWLIMARLPADISTVIAKSTWRPSRSNSGHSVWTDDRSSLVSVIRW